MTQIQMSRYDALLRRVADLKGPGSKVNDVLEELFPVIDVENVPGELLFLMGTKVAYGGTSVNAEAASFAKIQLFNPTGSGHLLTLTKVIFSGTVSSRYVWDIKVTPETAAFNVERILDTRQGTDELPVGQIRFTLDVASPTFTATVRLLASTPYKLENENGLAILAPGTGFTIGCLTPNATMEASFYWRERVAEPSELLL